MTKMLCFICLLVFTSAAPDAMDNAVDAELFDKKLKQHANQIKKTAAQQNASTDFAILIDMSLPSSKYRFFVYDLNNDSVIIQGLCGHGQGNDYRNEFVVFSNKEGSLCTSDGRYKIGNKYNGAFGTSYKLYGLDPTNSKAYERGIVLHAHKLVSDAEGKRACRSYGCPMVSPNTFTRVSRLIDASAKPLLLWIYK